MKWEKIKDNCIRYSFNQIDLNVGEFALVSARILINNEKYLKSRDRKVVLAKEIEKVISNWDIRNFESLRNLFPSCFPKKNKLTISYNDYWELI